MTERHRRKKFKAYDYAGYGEYHDFSDSEGSARLRLRKEEALKIIAAMTAAIAQGHDLELTLLKKNKHVMVYTKELE